MRMPSSIVAGTGRRNHVRQRDRIETADSPGTGLIGRRYLHSADAGNSPTRWKSRGFPLRTCRENRRRGRFGACRHRPHRPARHQFLGPASLLRTMSRNSPRPRSRCPIIPPSRPPSRSTHAGRPCLPAPRARHQFPPPRSLVQENTAAGTFPAHARNLLHSFRCGSPTRIVRIRGSNRRLLQGALFVAEGIVHSPGPDRQPAARTRWSSTSVPPASLSAGTDQMPPCNRIISALMSAVGRPCASSIPSRTDVHCPPGFAFASKTTETLFEDEIPEARGGRPGPAAQRERAKSPKSDCGSPCPRPERSGTALRHDSFPCPVPPLRPERRILSFGSRPPHPSAPNLSQGTAGNPGN